MDKTTLETFIKKYNLNGLVDGVRWVVKDNTLRVTSMTSDKKFLASITQKKFDGCTDVTIGVGDSQRLKTMLNSVEKDVTMTLVTDTADAARGVISVQFEDGKTEMAYMCSHLDVLQPEPKIKSLPGYDVEITLTEEFVSRFLKAKAALQESDLFTLLMNKKKQKLEMVLGYNRNLSHRIALEVPTVDGKNTVKSPLSFSAKNLKEILAANPEAKDPVLKVSEQGLAFIEFDTPEFQSQYYMIKIDVED